MLILICLLIDGYEMVPHGACDHIRVCWRASDTKIVSIIA